MSESNSTLATGLHLPTPNTSHQDSFPQTPEETDVSTDRKRSTDRSRDVTRSLLWEGNNPFDRRKVSFFLVETNAYRRQKKFVLQAETNVLALPKIGLKAVERENNRFPPKTHVSPANKNVSDLKTIPLFKTLV